MRLKSTINESTLSTADAVPLPQWGRLRYENTAFPETQPLTKGEGKEEAASPHFQKRYYSNTFFFCAFVNDSGNFLNNNIKMIHDLKIGISNNEDSELF